MKASPTIVSIVLFLILTGCNLPVGETTPTPLPPPTQPKTDTPSTPIPIETLLTFELPTVTPTSTPTIVLALPKTGPVNCRSGPGVSYNVMGELKVGRQAEMVGKSADFAWWYVKNPNDPSTFCWLAADFIVTQGNVDALVVVGPPAIVVTAVQVSIDPPVMNVGCNAFPRLVTIRVRITTTGPATVLWRWEEINTGDVSDAKYIFFEEGGTRTTEDLYQVKSARDYRLIVRTLEPNEVTGEGTFKAVCTP
jgi:hypothetical protein